MKKEIKKMKEVITIETHRDGYGIDQCGRTLTVGELIGCLSQWDDETEVYFSNDNGYTYGSMSFEDIDTKDVEEK